MIDHTDEFFVVGGTMRPQSPAYIERPADAELFERLRDGEFCYVLTARQMGKSSLMVRTARRLAGLGARSVVIDLTAIGTVGVDAWYLGLLSALRAQLRLPVDPAAWWATQADLSAPQRWVAFLHDVALAQSEAPLVVFVDEIDTTLGLSFRDDFFAAIRSVYNERATAPAFRRLTFALFGVAAPTDLIRDRARTPFNIGQRVMLGELSLADAAPLRNALDACHPGAGERILARIFHWTAGHPYLTQKLCAVAAQTAADDWVDDWVDALVSSTLLDDQTGDENLKFVQNRVRGTPALERRQMLRLYRRVYRGDQVPDDDRSPIQNQLELTGLVTVASGHLRVRNPIYRTVFGKAWINATMPRDRQRPIAIGSIAVAALLLLGLALRIWLAPTPASSLAEGYIDNFERTRGGAENISNHTTRLDSLARLFDLNDYRATQEALRLFYDTLKPEQQQFMFRRGEPGDGARMVTVARNIVMTLGAESSGADLDLLSAIMDGLERVAQRQSPTGPAAAALTPALTPTGVAGQAARLQQILAAWQPGRDAALRAQYDIAAQAYARVASEELRLLPALLYDRAVANARRSTPDYAAALRDLNAMLEAAASMPTPTDTPMPATTLTPTTPTAAGTPTAPSAATTSSPGAAATFQPADATSAPTTAGGAAGVSRELRDTNRFRNEAQIRRTIETLIQRDTGLAQAYRDAFGKGPYARLEAAISRPPQRSTAPSVAADGPTLSATPAPNVDLGTWQIHGQSADRLLSFREPFGAAWQSTYSGLVTVTGVGRQSGAAPLVISGPFAMRVDVLDAKEQPVTTGIDQLIFDISGPRTFSRTELNAPYCLFGGGEAACPTADLAEWPDGVYSTTIAIVQAQSGLELTSALNFSFQIRRTPQSLPNAPAKDALRPAIRDVVDQLPTDPQQRYDSRPRLNIDLIIFRYMTNPERLSGLALLQTNAQFWIDQQGFPGIPYHYVIDRDGTIYQTNRIETVSFHSGDFNQRGIGIAVVEPSDQSTAASDAQNRAASRLAAWLLSDLNLPFSALTDLGVGTTGRTSGLAWDALNRDVQQQLAAAGVTLPQGATPRAPTPISTASAVPPPGTPLAIP